MRRLRALVGKELRQHGLLMLLLVGVVLPIEALGVLTLALGPQTLTVFEAHATFLRFFVPLFAMVLGNRLIVNEYQQRSQLFLEGLPLRRWEMVALKWLLGLAALLLVTLIAFAMTTLAAALREPIHLRFLALMMMRSIGWLVAIWGMAFGMGFTGRFRLPIYLALGLLLAVVDATSDFELSRFAVFAMVDQTLALERETLDVAALLGALGFGLGWSALGFGLALSGEGSLAEGLARRMSAREKSAVGALLVIGTVIVIGLDSKKKPAPFSFPAEAAIARSDKLPIEVAYGSTEHREHAEQLVSALVSDLDGLPSRLGWKTLPPVRISWSGALDGRHFETVKLATGDGILVRAAFGSADFDAIGFRAAVIRALLVAQTDGRADFEPYSFFLDGYARHLAEAQEDPAAAHISLVRALYATRDKPVVPSLALRWHETREHLGPAMSEALARSAVHSLAASGGADAPDQVARVLFDGPPPNDIRALWALHADAPMQLIAKHAGSASYSEFITQWAAHLEALRAEPWAAAVAKLPKISGQLEVTTVLGQVRSIEGKLTTSAPLDRETQALLVHHPLTAFDGPLVERELEQIELPWAAGSQLAEPRLVGRYGPGERAFVALELEPPILGCRVRVAAERRVIR